MGGVDAELQRLEPVAGDQAPEGKDVGGGGGYTVEGGCGPFPKVGEDDANPGLHGVAALANAGARRAAQRLGRSVE